MLNNYLYTGFLFNFKVRIMPKLEKFDLEYYTKKKYIFTFTNYALPKPLKQQNLPTLQRG